ncbi:hypothetical protein [Massilia sp. Leaf139]|uniref:hypothetical protein n=1 Tax=Massilia sp. Leaf139 TaxID=1736272 RepID=UPI0006FA8ED6|nr:hypothetical protein [Massilia sp. Leaf139]KQQ89928.1 hypothetical protein ASF77_23405 [Massilia sp. Leaf139]
MKLLNKAAFFAAHDVRHEDVPVPQLDGAVRIRVMSGAARDAFQEYMRSFGDEPRPASAVHAALLVHTCIDEAGEPMFTMDDLDQLRTKSSAALDLMAAAAMRINGLGAAAVPDAEKNSASDQSDDSGSV